MDVLIVDDHQMVAEALSERLQRSGRGVSLAFDQQSAREALLHHNFDLLVLDLNLAGRRGIELLIDTELETRKPSHVVILSGVDDRDEIAMGLAAGAHAYVSKSLGFEELITALLASSDIPVGTDTFVWSSQKRCYLSAGQVFPRGTVLSPREWQVFLLMKDGLRDKEIAAQLGKSIHTIRVQIRSIMRKRSGNRRHESL
jgi:DNA-binding NarL/FixJ family response regulator